MGTKVVGIWTSLGQQMDVSTAARIAHTTQGWFRWAQRYCGWRVDLPVWDDPTVVEGWEPSGTPGATRGYWGLNAGVSGQLVDEVIARVPEVCKIPADEYHIGGVTNSIAGAYTAEQLKDLVVQAARDIENATGKPVKIYTVLARDTSSWADPSDSRSKAAEYNSLLEEQTEFEVVDFNVGWLDWTSALAIPVAANTADGIHFSGQGAFEVGKRLGVSWREAYPPAPPLIDSPTDNLIPGGFLDGSGGAVGAGVVGSVVNGMRVERSNGGATVTASVTTDDSVRGGVQHLVFAPAGVDESSRCYFRTTSADTSHSLAGKWIVGTIKIRINSANSAFDGINLYIDDQGTGGKTAQDLYDTGVGFITSATGEFVELRTPPMKLVDDSTEVRARLEVYVNGLAGANGDLDVAEFGVTEVPDPEVFYGTVAPGSRVVAPGVSLSSKNGILIAGTPVGSQDFEGGAQSILSLESSGLLVKAS